MFVVNHCWDDKQHIQSAVAIMERLGVGTVHSVLQGPLVRIHHLLQQLGFIVEFRL